MEAWKIIIGLIVFIIIGAMVILIYTNDVWITGFHIVCDVRDQKTFNAVIDIIVEQNDIRQCRYREIDDVIIVIVYCQKWKKEKLMSLFKKIENAEVQ